jgi:hypothetical protein
VWVRAAWGRTGAPSVSGQRIRLNVVSASVSVTLPKGALALLEQLVARGLYGESKS